MTTRADSVLVNSDEQRDAVVRAWNAGMATAEMVRLASLTISAISYAVAYFRSKGYALRPRPKGPNAGRRSVDAPLAGSAPHRRDS